MPFFCFSFKYPATSPTAAMERGRTLYGAFGRYMKHDGGSLGWAYEEPSTAGMASQEANWSKRPTLDCLFMSFVEASRPSPQIAFRFEVPSHGSPLDSRDLDAK
jgi:hypothetical protein